MPNAKYPLKPLLEHRGRQVDDATAELGTRLRAREAAEAARARAEGERRDAEVRADGVRAGERERLARGELRAADLARAAEWEIGAQVERDHLARAASVAAEHADGARRDEGTARADLGRRLADRDVVAKDAQRFDARQRARVLAAEEEAAEEAHRGGRR